MRLRAPKDKGHPTIRGTVIEPKKDGIYEVDDADGRHLVDSHGYIDADAPPKLAAAAPGAALRSAVVAALAAQGVSVSTDGGEELLVRALADLPNAIASRIATAEKAAEERARSKK